MCAQALFAYAMQNKKGVYTVSVDFLLIFCVFGVFCVFSGEIGCIYFWRSVVGVAVCVFASGA